ncbi:MAG: DUF4350 domain-containing protein [Bacteroidota bacterium]
MFKKGRAYIIIATLVFILLLVFEYNKPKKINWFPSYVATHKIPYGTKVINDLLSNYLPQVQQVYRTPYEFLSRSDTLKGTYLFVNGSITFGKTDLHEVMSWVEKGNHLFIASKSFDYELLDTLGLEVSSMYDSQNIQPIFRHSLVNERLEIKDVPFDKDYYGTYFSELDTLNGVVLGNVRIENDSLPKKRSEVTIVQQPYGKGKITLSAFPEAFTNYFMLKDDQSKYTAGLISYIDPNLPVFVDNHHKAGKTFYTSPMYLFLNTKAFKWAYYLILIGSLVYIIFEGKRKQRAIKVITPLKNQTLAFTSTIANMYYENNRQVEIAQHKIQYFLDYIRTRFYLGTEKLDHHFYRTLALRSNHSDKEVQELFKTLIHLQKAEKVSNEQLQRLEHGIQQFKARANGQ